MAGSGWIKVLRQDDRSREIGGQITDQDRKCLNGDQAKVGEASQNKGLSHAHSEEAGFSLTDVTADVLKPK
jgi:hypothetical protein